MRVCRDCGRELPEGEFYSYRLKTGMVYIHPTCRQCYNARKAAKNAAGRKPGAPTDHPVADPTRYLLAGILERALLDLSGFGRPFDKGRGSMQDGITDHTKPCDCDAHDALAWLSAYGADWCELLDLPREWAREAMNERMLAQQEAATA